MFFEIPKHSSRHINASEIESLTLIGNIHTSRWGWNPFNKNIDMTSLSDGKWQFNLKVDGSEFNEEKIAYSIRIIINHNPRRQLKVDVIKDGKWFLKEQLSGSSLTNINFYSLSDQELNIVFNEENNSLSIESNNKDINKNIQILEEFTSYQINGFVWDDLNMFEKFNPIINNKSFSKINDQLWSIDLPLKENGGIDFRSDGVYQFLISADFKEDFGFAALNDNKGSLVNGSGFSSSHGTSDHSGCTVKINKTGKYRINLHNPTTSNPTFSITSIDNIEEKLQPKILNSKDSIQILGTIFDEDQFNPLVPNRTLKESKNGVFEIELSVEQGDHSINFAINNELFLDTMGIGCWLDVNTDTRRKKLSGLAWHGKPQEFNIGFNLNKKSFLKFTYHVNIDRFEIEALDDDAFLAPVDSIKSLSIVGNFDSPLESWNPLSSSNLMNKISGDRFERVINLEAGKEYTYKYVANQSNWTLVFSDYELDCKGTNFLGDNDVAGRPTQRTLFKHGQLTTHGNPPPLEVKPNESGPYLFYADITTGSYSVNPLN